jgi:hypothetical protein
MGFALLAIFQLALFFVDLTLYLLIINLHWILEMLIITPILFS